MAVITQGANAGEATKEMAARLREVGDWEKNAAGSSGYMREVCNEAADAIDHLASEVQRLTDALEKAEKALLFAAGPWRRGEDEAIAAARARRTGGG